MRWLLIVALLVPNLVVADTCATRLMPLFTDAQAREVCEINFEGELTYLGDGTADNNFVLHAEDDETVLWIVGGSEANSVNGAGISIGGTDSEQVGTIKLFNSDSDLSNIDLTLTNASDGQLRIRNSSSGHLWFFSKNGEIASDATNGGNISLSKSGTTVAVQEATGATACMGAATPNGTTPVAVSTTCAASGARVFYSRAGAITDMGVISTTTAPSGTGFSFASTGASDTLPSSVIYLIVKEAA